MEAARDWFDDDEQGIFARFPTWEAVERNREFTVPSLNGLPKLDVLLKCFGGGSRQSAAGNWARCVQTGIGTDVLEKFIPSLSVHQIRHALGNINPSARRLKWMEDEARRAAS